MQIECMCVVCHGPIKRIHRVSAATCCKGCHYYWQHRLKPTGIVGWRQENLRITHSWRREHEAALARIQRVVFLGPGRVSA